VSRAGEALRGLSAVKVDGPTLGSGADRRRAGSATRPHYYWRMASCVTAITVDPFGLCEGCQLKSWWMRKLGPLLDLNGGFHEARKQTQEDKPEAREQT
jgi:hypothetical protein